MPIHCELILAESFSTEIIASSLGSLRYEPVHHPSHAGCIIVYDRPTAWTASHHIDFEGFLRRLVRFVERLPDPRLISQATVFVGLVDSYQGNWETTTEGVRLLARAGADLVVQVQRVN